MNALIDCTVTFVGRIDSVLSWEVGAEPALHHASPAPRITRREDDYNREYKVFVIFIVFL